MPSHIFTRLGMWNDSVASNQAARRRCARARRRGRRTARHGLPHLCVSCNLGRNDDAAAVVADLRRMSDLQGQQFKVGYAATAMPVRLAVERRRLAGRCCDRRRTNAPAGGEGGRDLGQGDWLGAARSNSRRKRRSAKASVKSSASCARREVITGPIRSRFKSAEVECLDRTGEGRWSFCAKNR